MAHYTAQQRVIRDRVDFVLDIEGEDHVKYIVFKARNYRQSRVIFAAVAKMNEEAGFHKFCAEYTGNHVTIILNETALEKLARGFYNRHLCQAHKRWLDHSERVHWILAKFPKLQQLSVEY